MKFLFAFIKAKILAKLLLNVKSQNKFTQNFTSSSVVYIQQYDNILNGSRQFDELSDNYILFNAYKHCKRTRFLFSTLMTASSNTMLHTQLILSAKLASQTLLSRVVSHASSSDLRISKNSASRFKALLMSILYIAVMSRLSYCGI